MNEGPQKQRAKIVTQGGGGGGFRRIFIPQGPNEPIVRRFPLKGLELEGLEIKRCLLGRNFQKCHLCTVLTRLFFLSFEKTQAGKACEIRTQRTCTTQPDAKKEHTTELSFSSVC